MKPSPCSLVQSDARHPTVQGRQPEPAGGRSHKRFGTSACAGLPSPPKPPGGRTGFNLLCNPRIGFHVQFPAKTTVATGLDSTCYPSHGSICYEGRGSMAHWPSPAWAVRWFGVGSYYTRLFGIGLVQLDARQRRNPHPLRTGSKPSAPIALWLDHLAFLRGFSSLSRWTCCKQANPVRQRPQQAIRKICLRWALTDCRARLNLL